MSEMTATPSTSDFEALLNETMPSDSGFEGQVVKGTVVAIENDFAIIDIGLKAEGRVPLKEFTAPGQEAELTSGDEVEVYVDRVENALGEAILSRDKARREEAWTELEKAFEGDARVEGVIFGRVKGGFTVDLNGAVAFLPGSQVDIRPIRDVTPLMNIKQPFQVLKMDRRRGNIVVSRRAILEEDRAGQRAELMGQIKEGDAVDGVVKNITDYGAFVDLGGIDGLLHVTDISWRRVNHPSEVLSIGETVKVQIVRINPETQRISLGMKQLADDPWSDIDAHFKIGDVVSGTVSKLTSFGAFVELKDGIDGLVHISQISEERIDKVKDVINAGDEVSARVIKIDRDERRLGLSIKAANYSEEELAAESASFEALSRDTSADMMNLGDILDDAVSSGDEEQK